MRVLSKKCWCLILLFLAIDGTAAEPVHGSVIFTIVTPDGIIMASDGLVIDEEWIPNQRIPLSPYKRSTEESEPKIAICNRRFLCESAGNNPVISTLPDIEYHFQEWLPVANRKTTTKVRDYAERMETKARITFKDMGTVLKRPEFWDPEHTQSHRFEDFGVAGYDGDVPIHCSFYIDTDHQSYRLIYSDISCSAVKTAPGNIQLFIMAGHKETFRRAITSGTPENRRANDLILNARAASRTLFPDAPPSIQQAIAQAVVLVALQGEFDPENIGGTTRIAVLLKGSSEIPFLHSPVNLSAAVLSKQTSETH